jgi:hypothetical protein
MWDLPIEIDIDGKKHPISKKCDYRVVLNAIRFLNDVDLTNEEKIKCALVVFYEDVTKIRNFETAIKEMFRVINNGQLEESQEQKPLLMDWEHDFSQLAPPVSRVLGYDVRMPDKYTHWYTFLGGYQEIGSECAFANIVSIRNKKAKGKKLEKWEQEFYKENRKLIDLPHKLTAEEQEFLDSDW